MKEWLKKKEKFCVLKADAVHLKVNESRYIALIVFSGSIKNLFSIDYVNIYLFSIFFSIHFARWKSVGLLHIAYIHYVKSVHIRRFYGPYFSARGLNTDRYSVFLRIQSECRKYGQEKLPIWTLLTQWLWFINFKCLNELIIFTAIYLLAILSHL